jgi:2,4-dienoyl-CoA reductase (NADPH2)
MCSFYIVFFNFQPQPSYPAADLIVRLFIIPLCAVFKNRIVMAPISVYNTDNGYATERDVLFYKERAKGGVGLIVFANMQWNPIRNNPNSGAMLTDEKYIPALKKFTDVVHAEGCKIFPQLMHKGRYATAASQGGEQPIAPPAIPTRFNGYELAISI